jgi:hypothetical protein
MLTCTLGLPIGWHTSRAHPVHSRAHTRARTHTATTTSSSTSSTTSPGHIVVIIQASGGVHQQHQLIRAVRDTACSTDPSTGPRAAAAPKPCAGLGHGGVGAVEGGCQGRGQQGPPPHGWPGDRTSPHVLLHHAPITPHSPYRIKHRHVTHTAMQQQWRLLPRGARSSKDG